MGATVPDELDVPHVDISAWSGGDRAAIAAAVDCACCEVGFMQISGHGIAQDVTDATLHSADRFFELPLDAKARRGTAAS